MQREPETATEYEAPLTVVWSRLLRALAGLDRTFGAVLTDLNGAVRAIRSQTVGRK